MIYGLELVIHGNIVHFSFCLIFIFSSYLNSLFWMIHFPKYEILSVVLHFHIIKLF